MNISRWLLRGWALSLLWLALPAHGDMQIYVTGSIKAAIPCVIQGSNTALIDVPFGDVQIAKIDGAYKTVPINYGLDCSRAMNHALRMRITGSPASFNNQLLAVTGNDNLGIALKNGIDAIGRDEWFNFNPAVPPQLKAVLVRGGGSTLAPGEFKTGATLVVDYQ